MYNIGDKVRCINDDNDNNHFTKGKIYQIANANSRKDCFFIRCDVDANTHKHDKEFASHPISDRELAMWFSRLVSTNVNKNTKVI